LDNKRDQENLSGTLLCYPGKEAEAGDWRRHSMHSKRATAKQRKQQQSSWCQKDQQGEVNGGRSGVDETERNQQMELSSRNL
jgi:hypothetical protein